MMRMLFYVATIIYFSQINAFAQFYSGCNNSVGQQFSLMSSPTVPGAIFITPANFVGNQIVLGPVQHPQILYANLDQFRNGIVLLRDGSLLGQYMGYVNYIANCWAGQPQVMAPAPVSYLGSTNSVEAAIVVATPAGQNVRVDMSSKGTVPLLIGEQQALVCQQRNNAGEQDFVECMVDGMLKPPQRQAFDCIREATDTLSGGACLARIGNPGMAQAIDTMENCQLDNVDEELDYDCIAQGTLSGRQLSAYKCIATAEDEDISISDCLDGLGASSAAVRTANVIQECYESEFEASDYALCALQGLGNRDVATAAKCVQEQVQSANPSYLGAGLCYAAGALNLNPEQQIAIECAVSSGAQPYAFAVCAGGRLTAREITKCFTDGVGGNGCFGPNNEIVKAMRLAGIDVNNLTNPNGEVIKAWNTVTNDIVNGPGPNNDLVRAGQTIQNDLQNGLGPSNDLRRAAETVVNDITRGPGPNNDIRKAVCGIFNC